MKPFREQNPIPIAIACIGLILLMLFAAFNAERLPIIGGGTIYKAQFSEAAGLRPDDEVRVAGVKVGKVDDIALEDGKVLVAFRIDDVELGKETGASIRIRTLLGRKYVALEPKGSGQLDPDDVIPLERTTSPFDVVEAFQFAGENLQEIDTDQLAASFEVLAETFKNSPDEVRASLDGLSRLSRTIASRDDQLRTLLQSAGGVTEVLADRNEEFTQLLRDGDLVFRELQRRRDVIHSLLVSTSQLSTQLVGLVRDNEAQLAPALRQLQQVTRFLQRNEVSLERTIANMAPFVRLFTNVLGTGRWFDTYVQNLVPGPAGVPRPPANSSGN